MAAPSFVGAGSGAVINGASGNVTHTASVGNFIILQLIEDGYDGGGTDFTLGTVTNVEDLAGTDSAMTAPTGDVYTNGFIVGNPTAAVQWLYFGRCIGASITITLNSAGNDLYARIYEFSDVNTGTSLSDVIENSTAGTAVNEFATSTTVADTGVTTLGADRLACNFIAVNDDNQLELTAMTGETGGDWTYPVTAYGSSTGTDGAIALVTATIASAGTINGGTDTMASDAWGVVGFALIPAATATSLVVNRNKHLNLYIPIQL